VFKGEDVAEASSISIPFMPIPFISVPFMRDGRKRTYTWNDKGVSLP